MPAPVVIVGAGISGLTVAYQLQKRGIPFRIFEKAPRVGGIIQTDHLLGCVVEGGPDSFVAAKPAALRLVEELGLSSDLIPSNDSEKITYIVREGKLVPLPQSMYFMVPRELEPVMASPLLSDSAKQRIAERWNQNPPAALPGDESVASFTRRHFGQEVLDYIAEPMLTGVFGGDSEQLSARSTLPKLVQLEKKYGNLSKGLNEQRRESGAPGPVFWSLRKGMAQLTGALHHRIEDHVEYLNVEGLRGPPWEIQVYNSTETVKSSELVLACPAHEAAKLLDGCVAKATGILSSIPYSSAVTVALLFERANIRHPLNGFGFLVPGPERRGMSACTWVGSKFSDRVPPHKALLRCFFGSLQPGGILNGTEAELVELACSELRIMMGIDATPVEAKVYRWPRSLPQYVLGHEEQMRKLAGIVEELPGLHLAGNYFDGVGIPDSIRRATDITEKVSG